MLKYLYSKKQKNKTILQIIEQKIINNNYTNKFYIRSSILDTKEILILDNNSNFFLINQKNLEKHLLLLKEKHLLGKALQLKEFIYSKKQKFKITYFINNNKYNNYISYLKLLFILKKYIKFNSIKNQALLIINKGKFTYFLNGLKGTFPHKNFNHLRKLLKKFKSKITIQQKFNIILKKYKKILLKSLILKHIKSNSIKNKYKNQLISPSIFSKNKKIYIKFKK